MNMYLQELKSMRKSTFYWICSMIALAALYFSIYPGIVNNAADFKMMMNNYPASIRAALGITIDDITSVLGFYSMIFTFIILLGAIQAMNAGISILSKEGRERTADFLLVKPVSRKSIVSAKLLAAITMILSTDVLYYGSAVILISVVKTSGYSSKLFFLINLTLIFIQLIFLSLGMVVSVFFNKLKSYLSLSLGIVFGFYIIGALIAVGKNDAERIFSPFRYFDIPYIIKNGSYEFRYLWIGAIIVIVSIAASYIIYDRKDIHSVS